MEKTIDVKGPQSVPLKKAAFTEKKHIVTFIFVTSLFLLWGVAITMGAILSVTS